MALTTLAAGDGWGSQLRQSWRNATAVLDRLEDGGGGLEGFVCDLVCTYPPGHWRQ